MICILGAAVTSPVLGRDGALFIANYFTESSRYIQIVIKRFISIAIAKDIMHSGNKELHFHCCRSLNEQNFPCWVLKKKERFR